MLCMSARPYQVPRPSLGIICRVEVVGHAAGGKNLQATWLVKV